MRLTILNIKKSFEKFEIIQLSFTIFNREKKRSENVSLIIYNCYSYNLYLFPNANDLKNLFQDSVNPEIKSILFKDFSKCINEGIHHLNQHQYRQLYKNITQNNINNEDYFIDTTSITGKSHDLTLDENIIKEIKENFLNEKIVANNYIMILFLNIYYITSRKIS